MASPMWISIALCALLVSSDCSTQDVTVSLQQGQLKGMKVSPGFAAPYYSFQGIPYTKPPTGELRFKAPVAPDPWQGTRDALQEGAICKQFDLSEVKLKGEEDCLFVNVYTPELPGSGALKPVMVWVHGGAFSMGSGNSKFTGPQLLLERGVLVVTFNYRLGAFGFLSTEDAAAPGNAGMKDQVAALQWVQQNIASFGGDPKRVTIFGVSAGGACVHHLMLSPMSRGLFHGAIAQSGSATNPWAVALEPRVHAFFMAEKMGFTGNSSQELVDFLRAVDADQLLEASVAAVEERDKLRLLDIPFVPAVEPKVPGESQFLPDDPLRLIERGKFHQVPFMTGVTTGEGIMFLKFGRLFSKPGRVKEIDENFVEVFQRELRVCMVGSCGKDLVDKIRTFYFGNETVSNETLNSFVKLCTDMAFVEGTTLAVEEMAPRSDAPVFLYQFSYEGALSVLKATLYEASGFPGVAHGDDLPYLFHFGLNVDPASPAAQVRDRMLTMWTSFAKNGNPTKEPSEQIPAWPRYDTSEMQYLDIGEQLEVKRGLEKERMDFWRDLYLSVKH